MRYIKQYGIQRSCTNYVKLLIEENFRQMHVLASTLGWKHGPHPEKVDWSGGDWGAEGSDPLTHFSREELVAIRESYETSELGYLVCLKDPYAWLVSFTAYESRKSRWANVKNLVRKVDSRRLPEYLNCWNRVHSSWLQLLRQNRRATSVRYEDLLRGMEGEMNRLSEFFSLERKGPFYQPGHYLMRGGERLSRTTGLSNRRFDQHEYYLNRDYLNYFTRGDLQLFAASIDQGLVETLGYQVHV